MGKVIAFLNQKGGVGKSTLALNVAACLSDICNLTLPHGRVLLADADKQATAMTWASLRAETEPPPFGVIGVARENLHHEIERQAQHHDYVVIDGPPHADRITRECIAAADLVVIPIEPGGASRWSADLIVAQLREAMTFKQNLKCGLVVSRKMSGTILGREAKQVIAEHGLTLLRTEVEQRIVYAEALTFAKTLFEYSQSHKAVFEIQNLVDYILELLDEPKDHNRRAAAAA